MTDKVMLILFHLIAALFHDKFIKKPPQVNTEAENAVLVGMAGEAAAIDGNTGRDYWMGGLRTDDGWRWQSGDPMDYTNWSEYNPDGLNGGPNMSLFKNGMPTYRWGTETDVTGADNGVICEIRM